MNKMLVSFFIPINRRSHHFVLKINYANVVGHNEHFASHFEIDYIKKISAVEIEEKKPMFVLLLITLIYIQFLFGNKFLNLFDNFLSKYFLFFVALCKIEH